MHPRPCDVTQVLQCIRSRGVSVYFCSQFPDDISGHILIQHGNRIQHVQRTVTPRGPKAVRAVAETFASNIRLDVVQVLSQLGVGEALASPLKEKGVPMPVERTLMCPPPCRIGPTPAKERATVMARRPVGAKYETAVHLESAQERQSRRAADFEASEELMGDCQGRDGVYESGWLDEMLQGGKGRQGLVETMAKPAARTIGSEIGQHILRDLLGGVLSPSRRR